MEDYVPTFVKVMCICNRTVNVRTAQAIKSVPCWNCGTTITVFLGKGKGNLRVLVGVRQVKPIVVVQ